MPTQTLPSLALAGGKTWSVSAQTTLAMLSIVVSSSGSWIAQVRDCARDCVSGLLSMNMMFSALFAGCGGGGGGDSSSDQPAFSSFGFSLGKRTGFGGGSNSAADERGEDDPDHDDQRRGRASQRHDRRQ